MAVAGLPSIKLACCKGLQGTNCLAAFAPHLLDPGGPGGRGSGVVCVLVCVWGGVRGLKGWQQQLENQVKVKRNIPRKTNKACMDCVVELFGTSRACAS